MITNRAHGGCIRNAVCKGRRAGCGWNCTGADQDLDADGATVDLDTIQGGSGLRSLVVLVEDDSCTAYAAASGVILQEDLLRSAYIDG